MPTGSQGVKGGKPVFPRVKGYGIVYFDWNRGSTRFELLLSKDIIKDLVQALKLEHPAEHMQEGIHYLIT